MNRYQSFAIVLLFLGLTIQCLDASAKNDRKQVAKRLFKRQIPSVYPAYGYVKSYASSCDYLSASSCDAYARGIAQGGVQLQRTLKYVRQRKLYVNGFSSLSAFQNGGMCAANTNLLNANAFEAIHVGHITPVGLASLNLFPVSSVDTSTLLTAGYVTSIDERPLFTALGMQAVMSGLISPTQLRSLNIYPLQMNAMSVETLVRAGYLTNDCIPTALGIAAQHIRYFPKNMLSELGCQSSDYSQMTLRQLVEARYTFGQSNTVTTIGLAALKAGIVEPKIFEELGVFPFSATVRSTTTIMASEERLLASRPTLADDLVDIGFFESRNKLITPAGFSALSDDYFRVEHYRLLKLWPCPFMPSIHTFVAAGYATYSGHLTAFGNSLLRSQYFPDEWLPKLGIHMSDDFHTFHQALRYGGYIQSDYHAAHTSISTAINSSAENLSAGILRSASDITVENSAEAVDEV